MTPLPLTLSAVQEQIRTAPTVRRTHVQAVAGAGKTKVLIDRAHYLIGQGVKARRIWFVVFSKAAQRELAERLGRAKLNCQVTTLHAFCLDQLGGHQLVTVLNDQEPLWRDILAELHLRYGQYRNKLPQILEQTWQQPLEALSADHQQLRTAAEQLIQQLDHEQEPKRHLRFTQLLQETQTYWERQPQALELLRSQFDHLIVDEVQDISPLQAELIEQLAGDHALLTVGDVNQAIFGFQGATPDIIRGFMDRADNRHDMEISYRCPAQHTLVAEALTGQVMVPGQGFQGALRVHRGSHLHLITVLQRVVQELVDRRDTLDEPVAVLAATNSEVEDITAFLRETLLVVHSSAEQRREPDPYCREVLWPVVKFLAGQHQPQGPNPLLLLRDLTANLSVQDRDLLHSAWHTRRRVEALPKVLRLRSPLLNFWQALEGWQGSLNDLPGFLSNRFPRRRDQALARHHCFNAQSTEDLLRRLEPQAPAAAQEVLVSTIHAAKGRQWSRVVLWDAGNRPSPLFRTDEERQEEVRLRYVAITRSTRDLIALLHPECCEAYQVAFDHKVISRIRRLESAFTDEGVERDRDVELARDLRASPSIGRYIRDISARHIAADRRRYLADLLGIDDVQSNETAVSARRSDGLVRRIPLTGLKRPQ